MQQNHTAYWARASRGFDFSKEDCVPTDLFNEVLWQGLMGGQPYPRVRTGLHLGTGRAANP